jgi:hypothetical protein
MRIYDDIIDFLAAGTTPKRIIELKASAETQLRVRELLNAQG